MDSLRLFDDRHLDDLGQAVLGNPHCPGLRPESTAAAGATGQGLHEGLVVTPHVGAFGLLVFSLQTVSLNGTRTDPKLSQKGGRKGVPPRAGKAPKPFEFIVFLTIWPPQKGHILDPFLAPTFSETN